MDVTTASAVKRLFPSYLGRKNRQPNPILLRVQKEDRSMPLKALMIDYCVRRGFPYEAIRFNHGGGQVLEAKSTEDLGEDVINAWDGYRTRGLILLIDSEEGCAPKLVAFIARYRQSF